MNDTKRGQFKILNSLGNSLILEEDEAEGFFQRLKACRKKDQVDSTRARVGILFFHT